MGFGGRGRGNGERSMEMPSDKDLLDNMDGVKPAKLSRLFVLARPEWPWLTVALVLLLGSIAPVIVLPRAFGQMMDSVNSDDDKSSKIESADTLILQLVILLVFSAACTLVRSFLFNVAGERVLSRIRIQLFKAILSQEIGMFDTRKTGELLSRLNTDTTSLQDVATSNISMFVRGITMLVMSAVLMFITSWQLALLIFTVVPVVMGSISVYSKAVKKMATRYTDALGEASDLAQESIANVRTMRSFAAEELEVVKYTRAVGDPDTKQPGSKCWFPASTPKSSYYYGVKKHVLTSTFITFVSTIGIGACVFVMWFGARLVIEGYLTVGELTAFMLYAVQIGASIGMMLGLVSQVFIAVGASRRTFQLIDRPPRIPVAGGNFPETPIKGHITFEDVVFAYPAREDVPVLKGFSVDIPVNATYAFVGTSGAGKSTVLSLLIRFYEVTGGRLLVDGDDIRSLDPRYLRHQMALVAQEPVLFGLTVAKNIAYGYAAAHESDPDAVPSDERVEAAAKAAFAHDFITDFPEGYSTVVGERGVRLSGGQKQRVAIARALLCDPRVLLLDEATSALDAESEHIVQRAIDAVMLDRTTLIVAHRLSTVRHADRIVVVEGGKVGAIGPHEELMESSQAYQDLVKRQLQQGAEDSPGGRSRRGAASAEVARSAGGPLVVCDT